VLAVREKLVALQKAMAQKKSLVMDGRDIGTNVIPDAEYKIFLTASPLVRARRRALEMEAKGMEVDFDKLVEEINERDWRDSHREHNPLKKAEDAVEVDTSDMTIDEVVAAIKGVMKIASC
jgi:cytidylate kinase